MMESKKEVMHTPELWSVKDSEEGLLYRDLISYDLGYQNMVASTYGINCEQDARRIVACVNACKHYTTEDLEDVGENLSGVFADVRARCAELIAQRDELLAALKSAGDFIGNQKVETEEIIGGRTRLRTDVAGVFRVMNRIGTAIAKCEVES